MDHFVFKDDLAVAYNDKICISHVFEWEESCSVKSSDLLSIISSITEKEFDMTVKKDAMVIKSKSTKAKLSIEVEENLVESFFASFDFNNMEFEDVPIDFKAGLDLCRFSISKDVNTDKQIYCAKIADNLISTTDSYRISEYMMESGMSDFMLPGFAVKELMSVDPLAYAKTKGWIHFLLEDDATFSCRTVDDNGKFPNTEPFFEVDNEEDRYSFPTEFKDVLQSLVPVCEGDSDLDKTVHVSIADELITCTVIKSRGEVVKTLKTDINGKFTFPINPIFLSQVLTEDAEILIDTENNKIIIEYSGFRHVLMVKE